MRLVQDTSKARCILDEMHMRSACQSPHVRESQKYVGLDNMHIHVVTALVMPCFQAVALVNVPSADASLERGGS
jgi:hypothetical protein